MIVSGPEEDRGSVTAWMLVVPLLVLSLGALTTDLWAILGVQQRLAAMADDAAAAGAAAVDTDALRANAARLDPQAARGRAVAALQGAPDRHLVGQVDVVAGPEVVSVSLTGTATLHLFGLIGADNMEVRVTGSARPVVRGHS